MARFRVDILKPRYRTRPSRINNQGGNVFLGLVVRYPPVKDGVGSSWIVPPKANHVSQFDVFITGRRSVRAK